MTEDNIRVRSATLADVAEVAVLLDALVEHRKVLPRTVDELAELVGSGFVAVADEQVVGFAALDVYSEKLAEIRGLVVAEGFQGQRVGRRLVEACVQLAHERNVMEVMAISSSERFFMSCGFEFTLPDEKKAFFLQTRHRH